MHHDHQSNRQPLLPRHPLCSEPAGCSRRGNDFVDILASHADLKQYLALRDSDPLYAEIRGTERLGIPCFIKEDGSKTLDLKEVLK